MDAADGAHALPPEVEQRVAAELAARNLDQRPVDAAAVLGATRNTQQRLSLLARAGDSPYVLLLEARVVYYDVLQGRFRWVVYGRATVARRDDLLGAASSEFEVPVFLTYDHEKEPEALKAAAMQLADRTGALLDNFLAAAPVAAPAPRASGAMYFILVDRFAPRGSSDDPQGFHGGSLQGVIDHLDDLRALGVSTLWLSPVFKMRTEKFFGYGAFHGYWTEDLTQVEPRFGDAAALQRLTEEAHKRGLKIVLDLVLNHVAPEGKLTREHPDWFHGQGSITDWNDVSQLETRDVSGLPDLAQEKPEVYDYLLGATSRWLGVADGFRLDAVKHIPLAFWTRFNRELRQRKPGLSLTGEALDGDPAHLARLQREGGFDSLFDFPVGFALTDVFCKDKPVGRLAATLSLDRLYPDPSALVTLLDDHDLPRVAGLCGGDLERVRQALLTQLLLRGTPLLTYGTESALQGLKEPENRADMDWQRQPLRDFIRQVLALRAAHPALASGEQRILAMDGELLLLGRALPGELIAVAVNRGSQPAALPAEWREAELLFGERGPVPARGALVLLRKEGTVAPSAARGLELRGTAPVRAGDALLAVGAGPELGSWDPAHGVPLPGALQLPSGTVAEFKLVIRHGDGRVEWESGDDRFVYIGTGPGALRLDLNWRA